MTQTRRLIDPDDPDLPENIYAIEGDDWEKALWRIEENLKQAPKNVGHFTHANFKPDEKLVALLDRMVEQGCIEDWDYGFTTEEEVDSFLTLAFNEMAFDGALTKEERQTFDELKDYLAGAIKPLLKVWPGETHVALQFRGREETRSRMGSHIDLGAPGKSKDWCREAFNDVSFYVLMPLNSVGTAFHDVKHVIDEGRVKEVKPGGLRSYYNTQAECDVEDLWYAKPWSISVLASHIWTHMPPMHCQPPTINNKPEKRALVFLAVSRLP